MATNYDELRRSFDNILKELDDICKSIDDLTDFEQNYYMKNGNRASTSTKPPRAAAAAAVTSSTPRNNRIYERYKKQFSLESRPKIRDDYSPPKLKNSPSSRKHHRLPDDKKSTPLLNSVIGSAASFFLSSDLNHSSPINVETSPPSSSSNPQLPMTTKLDAAEQRNKLLNGNYYVGFQVNKRNHLNRGK